MKSYKSRGNWNINYCVKDDCANRNIKCKECIKFNNFIPKDMYSDYYEEKEIEDEKK